MSRKALTCALLLASLVANGFLFRGFARSRPAQAGSAAANARSAPTTPSSALAPDRATTATAASAAAAALLSTSSTGSSLWEALLSRDPATFAANLRAAGLSFGAVRGAINALLWDLQTPERTQAIESVPLLPFWKIGRDGLAEMTYFKELRRLKLERERIVRSIFPEEQELFRLRMQTRFGPISDEMVEKISDLEWDYKEMHSLATSQSPLGFPIPWTNDQVNLLEQEKLKDIAALLSPSEMEQYQFRGSPTGNSMQYRLAAFDPTEREFREIYRLQSAADQAHRFGSLEEGANTYQQLATDIEAVLGPERYAEYQRATDSNYQAAFAISRDLGLPRTTAAGVHAIYTANQRREREIRSSQAHHPAQRDAQLGMLEVETRQKLSHLLTPAGVEQLERGEGTFTLLPGR